MEDKPKMTRGWFVKTAGKKILKAGYSNSDSYPSRRGFGFLSAIIDGREDEFLDGLEPCRNFCMELITKGDYIGNGTYFKYDYGYVLNTATRALKVYNYCKLLYTVDLSSKEETKKYLFLFEHCDDIRAVLTYDPKKLCYSESSERKLVKESSLDELKTSLERSKEERIELEDGHCIMSSSSTCIAYRKRLTTSNTRFTLDFIAAHETTCYDDHWILLLQTPFGHYIVAGEHFKSERGIVKHIRSIVNKDTIDGLMRLAEVLEMCGNAETYFEYRKASEDVKKMWADKPWMLLNEMLSAEGISDELAGQARIIALQEKR